MAELLLINSCDGTLKRVKEMVKIVSHGRGFLLN